MADNLVIEYHVQNIGAFASHLRSEAKRIRDSSSSTRTKGDKREMEIRAGAYEDIADMLDKVKIDGAATAGGKS
jgi:hypothetical protein